ncbi:MAG TPA: hypothetical protein VFG04_22320 [Planctomycetaceae bacterium]|nr:hypothetical protein [Planctomycetaceae bacterium]
MRATRVHRAWLALGLCLVGMALISAARAADRSAVDPQKIREVERLIGQLDSDTPSERTTARDALLALGPKILPLLPADRAIASAAARQALHEIRLRLQREAALASLAPSRVTLKGKYSLQSVLAQITSQTGNEFDTHALDSRALARMIAVDFRSRTFWSACDEVTLAAGLAYGTASGKRLELVDANRRSEGRPLAVADAGAFRVAVASASIRPPVVSRTGYVLRISWSLRAEPRLRPLFAAIAGSELHAQTKERPPLPAGAPTSAAELAVTEFRPISPAAKLELSMNEGQEPLRLETDFEFPAGRTWSPKIDFSGSLGVEMAAGPVRFVFDQLAAPDPPSQRAGDVVVRLRQVAFPTQGKSSDAQVEISAVYDQGGPAFESYRTWMYHNETWLETKDGRRLRPRPLVATRQLDDGGVAVEYNFADVTGALADFRLVYVAPTLVTPSPVQFHLRNIPTTRVDQQGAQR